MSEEIVSEELNSVETQSLSIATRDLSGFRRT